MRHLWLFCLGAALVLAQAPEKIPGIGPAGEIVKAHTGFQFTEGPASDKAGNVYFTDVRANRIHKIDTEGRLSTFLENTEGANGLMFDHRGRLIACQGGAGRIIAIDVNTKAITVVADKYQGKPFNRPNDLSVDRQGGVYFTDPMFGAGAMNQDKMAVYYVSPKGEVARIIDDLERPNGILLCPTEKNLFVLPSGAPKVMIYPVVSSGKLGPGSVHANMQAGPEGPPRGGDGLTIDPKGNLYVTNPANSAIEIFNAKGERLALWRFPEAPANCAFGGADKKTLFVTARTSVYTVRMETPGHGPW